MFFDEARQKRLADILMHVGNILFTASVAGKLVPGVRDKIEAVELAIGLALAIVAWGVSILICSNERSAKND